MDKVRLIGLLILMVGVGIGQVTNNAYTFTSNPPQAVTGLSLSLVGPQGSATYYYWVSAIYPIGHTFPAGPVQISNAPVTLTNSNSIQVNWQPVTGAIGYTVFRTPQAQFPQGGVCACAVIVGTANSSVNDVGAGLSTVTLNPTQGATTVEYLNNRDLTAKRLTIDTEINSPSITVGPYTFSGLPTNGALRSIGGTVLLDGKQTYCTDCTQTNPCAGGGTGAVAQRINGIWSCTSGAPASAPSACPGGLNTQVQFNDTGSCNGDALFNWQKTPHLLTVGSTTSPTFGPFYTDGTAIIGSDESLLPSALTSAGSSTTGHLLVVAIANPGDTFVNSGINVEALSNAGHDVIGTNSVAMGRGPTGVNGVGIGSVASANVIGVTGDAQVSTVLVPKLIGLFAGGGAYLSGGTAQQDVGVFVSARGRGTLENIGIDIDNQSTNGTGDVFGIRFGSIIGAGGANAYGISVGSVSGGAANNFAIQTAVAGDIVFGALTVTGAATGKNVVCVDTATGKLYASSTGTDCSN